MMFGTDRGATSACWILPHVESRTKQNQLLPNIFASARWQFRMLVRFAIDGVPDLTNRRVRPYRAGKLNFPGGTQSFANQC
jgi:hypothetical protein